MKHNMNIIQIKGLRGIILAACAVCCLAVGFIGFPGWILMHVWNYFASFADIVPAIGIIQGLLLWGIVIASYFTFRKNKLVVCLKTPDGLSEEELREVFADLKEQNAQEMILQSMIKARESELKIKESSTQKEDDSEQTEITSANKD